MERSMIQRDAARPENLSGTNGEPALHLNPLQVNVSCPGLQTIFDQPAELFITSEHVLLYIEGQAILVVLRYQDIVLHAASSNPPALYLQIESSSFTREVVIDAEEDGGMIELFLRPTSEPTSVVNEMFGALSACAAMHPDSDNNDENHAGDDLLAQQLDNPNHRWITADNADGQFEDAEVVAHSRGQHVYAEDSGEFAPQTNGHHDHEEEAPRKWRRTG